MALEYLHTNNASSNLRDDITAASTSVRVTTGQGTLFPNPGVNQGFFVTVEDRRSGRLEIMLCTSRNGDTFTVTRGQQGTIPQAFAAGVNVSNRITAEILNLFVAASVTVVSVDRLPPIPDEKLTTVNASRLFGTVPAGTLPNIPAAKLTSVPAASLTGTIAAARLPMIPAANLPVIPAALLTSVPAASLTGTIAAARLPTIPASLLTSVPAASLTGTIADARLPAAITATSVTATTLRSTANTTVGGALSVTGSITAGGDINGKLVHKQYGGYVDIGSYSSDYGAGYGQFYYRANTELFYFRSHLGGGAAILAGSYQGSGAELTGIPTAYAGVSAGGIGSLAFARCTGNRAFGATVSGSSLRTNNASGSDSSDGGSLSGTWRCLGNASDESSGGQTTLWIRIS